MHCLITFIVVKIRLLLQVNLLFKWLASYCEKYMAKSNPRIPLVNIIDADPITQYVLFGEIEGTPYAGASYAGIFALGAMLVDVNSGVVYRMTGTVALPAWTSIASTLVVNGTASTLALTAAQSGASVILDRAAGVVVTLPTPAAGLIYNVDVLTSVTSNNYKIVTGTPASQFMVGSILGIDTDSSNALAGYTADGTTIVAVTMNGTTTGGLKGTRLTFKGLSSTIWEVSGTDLASGTVATPFATS